MAFAFGEGVVSEFVGRDHCGLLGFVPDLCDHFVEVVEEGEEEESDDGEGDEDAVRTDESDELGVGEDCRYDDEGDDVVKEGPS